jgi:hypothetical protein
VVTYEYINGVMARTALAFPRAKMSDFLTAWDQLSTQKVGICDFLLKICFCSSKLR